MNRECKKQGHLWPSDFTEEVHQRGRKLISVMVKRCERCDIILDSRAGGTIDLDED